MAKKGKLFVISGPSGSGKDTLLKKIFEKDNSLKLSISATTRPQREGEVDGKDYYFKTPEEFGELIEFNGLLEWAEYCRNFYGTPREPIEKWLKRGYNVILEIDIDGAMQVQKKMDDSILIFIMPPSMDELEQRLKTRGSENDEEIEMRIEKAKSEVKLADRYQYIIVNDDLEKATEELEQIILAK